MSEAISTKDGVWIALKRCGCCVGVCREDGKHAAEHNNQVKLEWLDDGLTVRFVTAEEWRADYLPGFLRDCPHTLEQTPQVQEATSPVSVPLRNLCMSESSSLLRAACEQLLKEFNCKFHVFPCEHDIELVAAFAVRQQQEAREHLVGRLREAAKNQGPHFLCCALALNGMAESIERATKADDKQPLDSRAHFGDGDSAAKEVRADADPHETGGSE